MGNTTSSRIAKITSELSAPVTPLSDKELDKLSRSKNTFMQYGFASSVQISLEVYVYGVVIGGMQLAKSKLMAFQQTNYC